MRSTLQQSSERFQWSRSATFFVQRPDHSLLGLSGVPSMLRRGQRTSQHLDRCQWQRHARYPDTGISVASIFLHWAEHGGTDPLHHAACMASWMVWLVGPSVLIKCREALGNL